MKYEWSLASFSEKIDPRTFCWILKIASTADAVYHYIVSLRIYVTRYAKCQKKTILNRMNCMRLMKSESGVQNSVLNFAS